MNSLTYRADRTLVGHTLADADGNILAVDQSVCALFHRTEAAIVGMSYLDITHPDDRAWNRARVDTLVSFNGPMTMLKRYLRPDGVAVWCEAQVSRFDTGTDQGRLIGTLHVLAPYSVTRTPKDLWQAASRASGDLTRRRIDLGEDLFSDFAWTLLLQLYLAEAEGRCTDLTDLAVRSGSRVETVRRWLRVLEERGLVETAEFGCAAQLTGSGIAALEKLLDGTAA